MSVLVNEYLFFLYMCPVLELAAVLSPSIEKQKSIIALLSSVVIAALLVSTVSPEMYPISYLTLLPCW